MIRSGVPQSKNCPQADASGKIVMVTESLVLAQSMTGDRLDVISLMHHPKARYIRVLAEK